MKFADCCFWPKATLIIIGRLAVNVRWLFLSRLARTVTCMNPGTIFNTKAKAMIQITMRPKWVPIGLGTLDYLCINFLSGLSDIRLSHLTHIIGLEWRHRPEIFGLILVFEWFVWFLLIEYKIRNRMKNSMKSKVENLFGIKDVFQSDMNFHADTDKTLEPVQFW